MMFRRLIPLFLLIPAIAPAISKEMQELMRDVALLQQQVKDLQQSQDNRFATLTVMVQQPKSDRVQAVQLGPSVVGAPRHGLITICPGCRLHV